MKIVSLDKDSQYRKIYKKGKSSVQPSLVIYAKENGLDHNRLGITASKKIGKAVVRNRCKRRLRELYRSYQESLNTGFDIILVARGKTFFAPAPVLKSAFEKGAIDVKLLSSTEK